MQRMPIRAILFDVYGTLLDVHSAIAREGKELGARADSVSRLWRQKQLEYTWVWSLRGAYRSFRALTEDGLDFALATETGVYRGRSTPSIADRPVPPATKRHGTSLARILK